MLKLQSKHNDGRHALLLDHRQLISKIYSEVLPNSDVYELKEQLFQFQPKTTKAEQNKRKRKFEETNDDDDSSDTDNIKDYLAQLPKPKDTPLLTKLERYWETEYTIPKLHGSNVTGQFQKFQTTNESNGSPRSFVIPQAVRFYNHNVDELTALLPQLLPSYDLIVIDPPWRNKYIRRIKRAKGELGYSMMDNDQLALLPVSKLIHERSLVTIWCTNSAAHQDALENQFLPRWHLRLLHKLRWYKVNTEHQLIGQMNQSDATKKKPYESLYIACHVNSDPSFGLDTKETQLLLSVPSIIHSHKPPLLAWLRSHLQLPKDQTEPNCLELFARYLHPQFTSIGLEVLKLMDERLYEKNIL